MKIPVEYAFEWLNRLSRGFGVAPHVPKSAIATIADNYLVRVAHLTNFFKSKRFYQQARPGIRVPREYWAHVVQHDHTNRAYAQRQMRIASSAPVSASPSRRSSRNASRNASPRASPRASPSRSRSPSPRIRYRKGELVMNTKLGEDFSPEEIRDAPYSLMAIQPSGDECDDTDVNLPMPACKAIRKVCRNYNTLRQYTNYQPDGSERSNYQIRVKYGNGNTSNNTKRKKKKKNSSRRRSR